MPTITAAEAKNRFGQFLETAQREPVTITKNGREVAVVLGLEEARLFAEFQSELEDRKLAAEVDQLPQSSAESIGQEATLRLMNQAFGTEGLSLEELYALVPADGTD